MSLPGARHRAVLKLAQNVTHELAAKAARNGSNTLCKDGWPTVYGLRHHARHYDLLISRMGFLFDRYARPTDGSIPDMTPSIHAFEWLGGCQLGDTTIDYSTGYYVDFETMDAASMLLADSAVNWDVAIAAYQRNDNHEEAAELAAIHQQTLAEFGTDAAETVPSLLAALLVAREQEIAAAPDSYPVLRPAIVWSGYRLPWMRADIETED